MEIPVSRRNSQASFKAFSQVRINHLLHREIRNRETQTKVAVIVKQGQIKVWIHAAKIEMKIIAAN